MRPALHCRFLFALVGSVGLLLLAPSRLLSQSSRGTLVGGVRDPSGASIPGTIITITNIATNVKTTYTTDATGDYYVPSLLPGHYRIEAERTGFKKATVDDVTLEVNKTLRVDITMVLGQMAEAVEVSAGTQLVQTDSTTLGQVIVNRQVTELPLNGRDFTNLLKLN